LNLRTIQFKLIDNIGRNRFIDKLKNADSQGFFLFGHGSIHGLDLNGNIFYYRNLMGIKIPSKFSVQFHCNHGIGDSLPKCLGLSDPRDFFDNGKRTEIMNLAWLLSNNNFLLN
jgi:hypothetical protein